MSPKPPQTAVDSYILTRLLRELPPSEFVLYLALYEIAIGSRLRTVALGIQGLSDLTGLSKSSIQRLVKGLKKRRLISVSFLKPTSTPEYEVHFPWRKAGATQAKHPEKLSIVKKNIEERPASKEGKSPELPIPKLNIDEAKPLDVHKPQGVMSLSVAALKWGKKNPFYLTLKQFKEKERHFQKALSREAQEAWISTQKSRVGSPAGETAQDVFGFDVAYSRALDEWWRLEAPKRGLTLKTKLPSAIDAPKRSRRTSIRAMREAQDVANALAIFQQKEKGFKSSLSPQEQKRWIEEHLKKLGPETQTWGKNALGLDIGYQLAVEAWWKATGKDLP